MGGNDPVYPLIALITSPIAQLRGQRLSSAIALSTTQLKIGSFLTIKARLGFASPERSSFAVHQSDRCFENRRLCGWLSNRKRNELNLIAQPLELLLQSLQTFCLRALPSVASTVILIELILLQHVMDRDQQSMGHGNNCSLVSCA